MSTRWRSYLAATTPENVAPAPKFTSTTTKNKKARAMHYHAKFSLHRRATILLLSVAVAFLFQSIIMQVEADPQQSASGVQVLDQDTYNGRTPDASYSYINNIRDELLDPRPLARPSHEVDEDMQQLAESMSLRELAGQMTQIQIGMLIGSDGEVDLSKVHYWINEWAVGSFLDTPTK